MFMLISLILAKGPEWKERGMCPQARLLMGARVILLALVNAEVAG
jgi:hypothetical protein